MRDFDPAIDDPCLLWDPDPDAWDRARDNRIADQLEGR